MPTFFEEIRDLFNYSVKHKNGLIASMLMKDDDGNIYYSALFGVYVLPVLCCWGFYKLMQIPFDTSEDTIAKTKELEAKNEVERRKI